MIWLSVSPCIPITAVLLRFCMHAFGQLASLLAHRHSGLIVSECLPSHLDAVPEGQCIQVTVTRGKRLARACRASVCSRVVFA